MEAFFQTGTIFSDKDSAQHMDITPFYLDARNAVTQPDKMVFLSQYFRRHWMPRLKPLGTAVVIYLRGACFHNRHSGETRDTIQISQREIAAGCGCSVATLKRELEQNEALARFVQVSQEYERNGANGRVRQLENVYKIAMDDPLTEADEERVRQMAEEGLAQQKAAPPDGPPVKSIRVRQETGLTACSKAGSASVLPCGSTAYSHAVHTACSKPSSTVNRQPLPPVAHFELLRPVAQNELGLAQNELLYKESSLLKTTPKETFNVRAAVNFVDQKGNRRAPNSAQGTLEDVVAPQKELWDKQVHALVEELRDWGSERRHRQLLSLCKQHGLADLPTQALHATRARLAKEKSRGLVEKPGAYYARVLLKLLEDRQVFVPTAGEDDPEEVRCLIRESFGTGEETLSGTK